jgi:Kdo2-lipid IVA lauroyltransferase/acyltransferase
MVRHQIKENYWSNRPLSIKFTTHLPENSMPNRKQIRRRIRRPFETAFFKLFSHLTPRIPRMGVVRLSRLVGRLMWLFPTREKHYALTNLNAVFGDTKTAQEKKEIVITSFATFCQTMLDLFWFAKNPAQRIPAYVHLTESTAPFFEDKAIVCITAHFGNWEILAPTAALKGVDIAGIAAEIKNETINRLLIKRREKTGNTVIPRKGAVRPLLALLRKKGKAAFVLDQHTSVQNGGIEITFLGLPMTVSSAPAMLAYRTGCDIVLGFSIPRPNGHYQVEIPLIIHPPAYDKEGDTDAIVQALTQQIEDGVSAFILQNPQYWLWSYKHWRGQTAAPLPEHYPTY